jgi:hypothetical protein
MPLTLLSQGKLNCVYNRGPGLTGVTDTAESILALLSQLFQLQKAPILLEDIIKPNPTMGKLYCQRPRGPGIKQGCLKKIVWPSEVITLPSQLQIRISRRIRRYVQTYLKVWNRGPEDDIRWKNRAQISRETISLRSERLHGKNSFREIGHTSIIIFTETQITWYFIFISERTT